MNHAFRVLMQFCPRYQDVNVLRILSTLYDFVPYFKLLCVSLCVKVSERERVVAERFYLKQYSDLWAESQRGGEEERRRFEEAHPRYATLANGEERCTRG